MIFEIVKFEKLISLCHSKLATVEEKISKALSDGKNSEEFKLVSDENSKYEALRSEILRDKKEQN